ncbi:PQQ-binding-like beta-propeller repeat protein [soil metagenome]
MGLKNGAALGMVAFAALFLAGSPKAQAPSPTDAAREALPGHAVFDQACAVCHLHPETVRAPALSTLKAMPADQLRFALTQGVMRQQGAGLSDDQREQVIAYLAAPATPAALTDAWIEPLRCSPDKRAVDVNGAQTLTTTSGDIASTRHMTAARAGLTTAKLSNLEVAWTLALPQTTTMRATPLIVGSTLFYTAGQIGQVLALDTRTGCVKWNRKVARQLRASPTYGDIGGRRMALIVPDALGQVHALDPKDGAEIWSADPRPDPTTPISGGLVLYGDRIIVPISAADVGRSGDRNYKCCVTHGAVAAMDAATGKPLWAAHTMEAAKYLGRKSTSGQEMWGPSGAPIWSTPTVDAKRGLVYVGTGENTSLPSTDSSDAILALDLKTGARRWTFQATRRDIWNVACHTPGHPNCAFTDAESIKRDWDFGAGPILVSRGGKSILLAGQKSGHVYGLDPDAGGKVLWTQRFGTGTSLGGVHWGMATDGVRLFVPVNDPVIDTGDSHAAGLNALDPFTGKLLWSYAAKTDCEGGRAERVQGCLIRYGFSAAPLLVDGALIAAQLDGRLHVFDAKTGSLLFSFDTAREFPSTTGVKAKGGSIDAQSIAAGDGMVFVGSGYGAFSEAPGNVLIAFKPKAGAKP